MKGRREERCVRCSCDYIAPADGLDYVSGRAELLRSTRLDCVSQIKDWRKGYIRCQYYSQRLDVFMSSTLRWLGVLM